MLPFLLFPQPQDALEDSLQHGVNLCLEQGDLGQQQGDPHDWSNRTAGSVSEDYFDSRSWHSDTLSDLGPDGFSVMLDMDELHTEWLLDSSSCHTLADHTLADPTLADPTLADPTLADPTLGDPTLADPTLGDHTLGDHTLGDSRARRRESASSPRETPRDVLRAGRGTASTEKHCITSLNNTSTVTNRPNTDTHSLRCTQTSRTNVPDQHCTDRQGIDTHKAVVQHQRTKNHDSGQQNSREMHDTSTHNRDIQHQHNASDHNTNTPHQHSTEVHFSQGTDTCNIQIDSSEDRISEAQQQNTEKHHTDLHNSNGADQLSTNTKYDFLIQNYTEPVPTHTVNEQNSEKNCHPQFTVKLDNQISYISNIPETSKHSQQTEEAVNTGNGSCPLELYTEAGLPFSLSVLNPSSPAPDRTRVRPPGSQFTPPFPLTRRDGDGFTCTQQQNRGHKQQQTQNSSSQEVCSGQSLIPELQAQGDAGLGSPKGEEHISGQREGGGGLGVPTEPQPGWDQIQFDTEEEFKECVITNPHIDTTFHCDSSRLETSSQLLLETRAEEGKSYHSLSWERKRDEAEDNIYLQQGQDIVAESTAHSSESRSNTGTSAEHSRGHQSSRETEQPCSPSGVFLELSLDTNVNLTQCEFSTTSRRSTEPAKTGSIHSSEPASSVPEQPKLNRTPPPPCHVKASPHSFSDSNNNTKLSKCSSNGDVVTRGTSLEDSRFEDRKKSAPSVLTDPATFTLNPPSISRTSTSVDSHLLKDLQDSEEFLASLDHEAYWSSEDSAVSVDHTEGDPFNSADVEEVVKCQEDGGLDANIIPQQGGCREAEEVHHSNRAKSSFVSQSNSLIRECLKPTASYLETRDFLLEGVDKEEWQHSSHPHKPSVDREGCSSPEEEYTLAEEFCCYIPPGPHSGQHGARIVRHPDISLSLLSISSLEPIVEDERSQENSGIVEDEDKVEDEESRESAIIRPVEEEEGNVAEFSESSKNHCHSEGGKEHWSEHRPDPQISEPDDFQFTKVPQDREMGSNRHFSPDRKSVV